MTSHQYTESLLVWLAHRHLKGMEHSFIHLFMYLLQQDLMANVWFTLFFIQIQQGKTYFNKAINTDI